MRCFGRHFIHGGDDPDAITAPPPPSPSQSQSRDVVCDEEVILGAVQASAAPPPRTGA